MKAINQIISLALSLCLIVAVLTSCGTAQINLSDDSDKISIVTTIFPPYDFARQIAGQNADITMLLPPGTESHSYEPSPRDIITIQNCDIFVYGGGESDEWIDSILESMDVSNMQIISMMEVSNALHEETVEGMQTAAGHDHEHDEDEHEHEHDEDEHEHEAESDWHTSGGSHEQYDEHVWTSPKNSILICRAICDALCSMDAVNIQQYKQACEQYILQLEQLDDRFEDIVANAKRKSIIFGDRFPFLYLVKEYDLSYWAAYPGCSSETEVSAATLAFLIDKVKAEQIPVVFYLEFSNQKIADIICESTNAKKLQFHSCHTISSDDLQNGVTYIDLMNQNADNLKEALN